MGAVFKPLSSFCRKFLDCCEALLIPDPFYTPHVVLLLHQRTHIFSLNWSWYAHTLTHTQTQLSPHCCLHPAGRNIVSQVSASSCGNGRHVGNSSGQAEDGGHVSVLRGCKVVYLGTFLQPFAFTLFFFSFVAACERCHLPTATHLWLRESL